MSTQAHPGLKHTPRRQKQRRPGTRGWLCLLLLCIFPLSALAQSFSVLNASLTLKDGVYRLDAQLALPLPEKAIRALENGIPLTFALDIEVSRSRRYMWNDDIASLVQRTTIQYFALTDQYILHNLNSGHKDSYSSLASALRGLENIRDLPVIDAKLLDPDKRYRIRIRSYLDFDGLPVPLRMRAYVSSDWWLTSGWHTWDIRMPQQ